MTDKALTIESETRCFGGWQRTYSHASRQTGTDMHFAVYLPPAAEEGPVPALFWLSGLTCTQDNFSTKAGAQRYASDYGLALIIPDTSPRGTDLPGEHESYDFGSGAGFYVDATQAPWSAHYRMYSYISDELPNLVFAELPIMPDAVGISGHSMGGHGALVIGLRRRDLFKSLSAFSPIANPMACPWGQKAFGNYLGEDQRAWEGYDACALINSGYRVPQILVEQGMDDQFLETQLVPEALEETCSQAGQPLTLNRRDGYDHSYFFVSTFIGDHLRWHKERLIG